MAPLMIVKNCVPVQANIMSNDITSIYSNRAQVRSNQAGNTAPDNSASPDSNKSSANSSADRLTLTNTASRMRDIEQKLSSASPVDTDRVQQMQSAIANGQYQVNPERIADKMMSFESLMN